MHNLYKVNIGTLEIRVNIVTITFGSHTLEGPYISTDSIENRSGVYVILCKVDDKYDFPDSGESSEVKSRIDNHDNKDYWKRQCQDGTVYYAVKYTPNLQQEEGRQIEMDILASEAVGQILGTDDPFDFLNLFTPKKEKPEKERD